MHVVSRCMIAARWRRRGWTSIEPGAVAQDLELGRDATIVDEIPPEYWPSTWASRLRIEATS